MRADTITRLLYFFAGFMMLSAAMIRLLVLVNNWHH